MGSSSESLSGRVLEALCDDVESMCLIGSTVCLHQMQAPGTVPLHGDLRCDPALNTEGLQHHTVDMVSLLFHGDS